jgi:hypothetical protein
MPTREELYAALRNADAAGDTAGAQKLAAYIQSMPTDNAAPAKSAIAWSDVPLEALKNTPKSAGNFVGGLYQAVRHPIDTLGNVADIAVGGVYNALPKPLQRGLDYLETNPEAQQRAIGKADMVGQMYKDRYGSMEGVKNTLATDPVGVAGDVSTVLGVGAAVTPGKLSAALSRASSLTNPLSAVAPIARGVGKVVEPVASNTLGMLTGVGADNVRMAAKSGLNKSADFMNNLSGKANMTDVLETAKANLQNMGAQKSAQYRANMASIKGDKSVLAFDGVDSALKDAVNAVTYKGQVKNAKGAQVASEISEEIAKWKALDPSEFHTPEGLDALKQKIGGIVDSIPLEEKTARMVGNGVYNAIKKEISAQAPTYAKTMKEYADATEQIREIERALVGGKNASADTAMRKLQSLSRNNASTNYGNRLDLAKALEAGGGNEILPAIAGQAMNTWTPRGLVGQAGGMANVAAAMSTGGATLGLLPFQSPKAVGMASYGAGRLARLLKDAKDAGPLTAEQTKLAALLTGQAGNQ